VIPIRFDVNSTRGISGGSKGTTTTDELHG
jgi:hypothetical protein